MRFIVMILINSLYHQVPYFILLPLDLCFLMLYYMRNTLTNPQFATNRRTNLIKCNFANE